MAFEDVVFDNDIVYLIITTVLIILLLSNLITTTIIKHHILKDHIPELRNTPERGSLLCLTDGPSSALAPPGNRSVACLYAMVYS